MFGADEARKAGFLNEYKYQNTWSDPNNQNVRHPDNPSVRPGTILDLYNNEEGIRLSLESLTYEEFREKVARAANDGTLITSIDEEFGVYKDIRLYECDYFLDIVRDFCKDYYVASEPLGKKTFVLGTIAGLIKRGFSVLFATKSINENFLGTLKVKAPGPPLLDPLALDLDGDGVETVGEGAGIFFDHNGDGVKKVGGWIKGDDGFLVFDRNGNARIDDGGELFGNNYILAVGYLAVLAYGHNNTLFSIDVL